MIRGFGVDLDKYTMAPEPQSDVVIIMASRLLKDKGVYEFVEAAMKIKAKGINVRFQLVGEPDFLSLSLYSDIADYAKESEMWVGFQANFFVYTVFWCLGFYFSQRYVKQEYIENYIRLWKFYCVLMMAYFFFGFGAFSNRYAFIGWLFLPVIQAFFIVSSRFDRKFKFFLASVFLIFGLFSYLYLVFGFSF